MKKVLTVISSILLCLLMMSGAAVSFAADSEKLNNTSEFTENAYTPEKEPEKARFAEGEAIAVLKNKAADKYLNRNNAASLYGKGIKMLDSFDVKSGKSNKELKLARFKSGLKTTDELVAELEKN
ncbi:MAG: hypothetical protein IJ725_01065, partial [Ruminococcus sp.]|nr:hypothetical protein [Ruminococcus sp.]